MEDLARNFMEVIHVNAQYRLMVKDVKLIQIVTHVRITFVKTLIAHLQVLVTFVSVLTQLMEITAKTLTIADF